MLNPNELYLLSLEKMNHTINTTHLYELIQTIKNIYFLHMEHVGQIRITDFKATKIQRESNNQFNKTKEEE